MSKFLHFITSCQFRTNCLYSRLIGKQSKKGIDMTTSTAPKALPKRDEIETKYTWDLTDIYADDQAWEKAYVEAEEMLKKAPGFLGKVTSDAKTLYECLELETELGKIIGRLHIYAYLKKDLDNRSSEYQAMCDRAAMLGSKIAAAFSFVEPELVQLEDDKLLELSKQFPKTDVYDFYIKEVIRSKKHIRSAEVEEVLAQSSMMARGADSIFTMLNDADLTYGTVKDEDGNEVVLTKQRFAKFLDSPNRQVRHDAYYTFYKAYQDHINALGASLSASVNKDLFYVNARRYESCLHSALDNYNIPTDVYHTLINTTEKNMSALHKYTEIRKRILKLDEINAWDMMVPLFPERDFDIPYEEAVEEILKAVQPLGDRYVELLKKGFTSRWIDVYETEGKGSGAYSTGIYNVHPYVLMNYNDTLDNMFTLAHEMGHALHSYFSNEAQHYTKSHYSIFVAEVASTLNEGLLQQHLLKKAESKIDKLYLLNRHIDNTWGTYFYQVLLGTFELKIHELVEHGQALSPEIMNEMYAELIKKYYGPAFSFDEYSAIKWCRIPHFYRMYYVYQYATSYAASQAILDKFLAGESGIIEKYLTLLASGGNDFPIEQLKICGVDMTTPSPFEATIKLFSDQVDEMDKLTA